MLTFVRAGPYSVHGLSVGGVYTALYIPELGAALDVGLAPRSFAPARCLFLSHAHVDHAGALTTMLGIRGLFGVKAPLRVFLPAEISDSIAELLAVSSAMQRYDLAVSQVPMRPGDTVQLERDLWARAFRTYHPVPALGYQFLRRVQKLRPEFADLPGSEIASRRKRGDSSLFEQIERIEVSYATDTLADVLHHEPSLFRSRVLILECTFLDERKSVKTARSGCHIHLDEIIAAAPRFENEYVVLMHFSQIYQPAEVHEILARRCPRTFRPRLVPFAPTAGHWPG